MGIPNTIKEYKELVNKWRLTQQNKVAIPSMQELLGWLWKTKEHNEYKTIIDKLLSEGIDTLLFEGGEIIFIVNEDKIKF